MADGLDIDIVGAGKTESGGGVMDILGGLGSLPIVGDLIGAYGAHRENVMNREFQANQSASQHQREVADLRAAGLNPILSGTGGGGNSAMSGGVPSLPSMSSAVSSGYGLNLTREMIGKAKAEKAQAENENVQSEFDLSAREETYGDEVIARKAAFKADAQNSAASVGKGVIDEKLFKEYPWLRMLEAFSSAITGGAGSAKSVIDLGRSRKR